MLVILINPMSKEMRVEQEQRQFHKTKALYKLLGWKVWPGTEKHFLKLKALGFTCKGGIRIFNIY